MRLPDSTFPMPEMNCWSIPEWTASGGGAMSSDPEKDDLSRMVADLKEEKVLAIVRERMMQGIDPLLILESCQRGMRMVGQHYEKGTYFISGLIIAGEIMREIGKLVLPGVKMVNVGNEGVQLNFMRAHHAGEPCPPQINIDLFSGYAKDLVDLVGVDAVMITCSTMNRAYKQVSARMKALGVPTVQIDEAMMEEAVNTGGRILVVATHGPTVKSTQNLLQETADRLGKKVDFAGATVEEAFERLGQGRIAEHNEIIADAIRKAMTAGRVDIVVLAQLSMAVFAFSHPDPAADFGVRVLNSAETGFRRAGEVLRRL